MMAPHSQEPRKRILVVDDEPELREILFETLSGEYLVSKAQDGLDALKLIERFRPDLIISDVRMPKLDGLEMLRQLSHRGISIPTIFITGFSDVDSIRKALQLGAFDFLDKPVETRHLMSLVAKGLEFGSDTLLQARKGETNWIAPETWTKLVRAAQSQHITPDEWIRQALILNSTKKAV